MTSPPTAASASGPDLTRPKSPPLAFDKSPHDALVPPSDTSSAGSTSSVDRSSNMGRRSPTAPPTEHGAHLQVLVDQQASAIQLLHDAFAAERQAWSLERERLFQRIAGLEQLLKSGNHYR